MGGAPTTQAALIGRAAELERGDRLVDTLARGRGALLLVNGDAGVGKSALATAIAQRAASSAMPVALARCYESGGLPAFAPWQELLEHLESTGQLSTTELPPPFGSRASTRTEYELRQVVSRALIELARGQCLVLVLEDIHWADQDTLELLWFLARQLDSAPILLIATYRTESVHRDHPLAAMLPRLRHDCPAEVLRLAQLSESETKLLVETIVGPATPQLAAHLHSRAEGNPFYIVELLRDLHEQQLLRRDDAGCWLPPPQVAALPSIVQHILVQRVTRLGDDGEALLTTASAVGQEWQLDLVEAVLGWDESRLLTALEAALEAGIVVSVDQSTESYRFAHALLHEVVYGQLVFRRRKQLHQRVGDVLEERLVARPDQARHAALAFQFAAAEDRPKAASYAYSAGDWSHARYATHSALRLYELAREALQHIDTVEPAFAIRLHERIARLHLVLHQQERALAEFVDMRELARRGGDIALDVEALASQSATLARINRMPEARALADEVMRLCLVDPPARGNLEWLSATARRGVRWL